MRVEAGIDLVEVARMEKSLASPRFWQRVFSPREREEIGARPNRAQSAAAVFAAKEACAKAMGTGFRGIRLVEIELLHDGSGKPELHLSGAAGEFAQSKMCIRDRRRTRRRPAILQTGWRAKPR